MSLLPIQLQGNPSVRELKQAESVGELAGLLSAGSDVVTWDDKSSPVSRRQPVARWPTSLPDIHHLQGELAASLPPYQLSPADWSL